MTDIELLLIAAGVIIGFILIGFAYIIWAGIQEHRHSPPRQSSGNHGASLLIGLAMILGALAAMYYLANTPGLSASYRRFSPFFTVPFWLWYFSSRPRYRHHQQYQAPPDCQSQPEPAYNHHSPRPPSQAVPPIWAGVKIGNVSELIRLTRDRETAERLIAHNLKQNPGRDRNWACEKAIADLERDRA